MAILLFGNIVIAGFGCTKDISVDNNVLLVYCGAGMKKPMDEIGCLFEQKYGVTVEYNYAGSGHLLSQMEMTRMGDVYQPGASYYLDVAEDKGIIDRREPIAYHIPVITVTKGNPCNITCLDDLTKQGMKVVLGNIQACAIGKVSDEILTKRGIKKAVGNNVVNWGATVNELVISVALGHANATITWNESAFFAADKVDIVEIPMEHNIIRIIPIGTLTFSKNSLMANRFIDFVASDEGLAVFKKHGFIPYPNE